MEKNLALIKRGEDEFHAWAKEIRMLNKVEALNLTTTRELANVWRSVVIYPEVYPEEQLARFEKMILETAQDEWGEDATVEFNRSEQKVTVHGSHGITREIGA